MKEIQLKNIFWGYIVIQAIYALVFIFMGPIFTFLQKIFDCFWFFWVYFFLHILLITYTILLFNFKNRYVDKKEKELRHYASITVIIFFLYCFGYLLALIFAYTVGSMIIFPILTIYLGRKFKKAGLL